MKHTTHLLKPCTYPNADQQHATNERRKQQMCSVNTQLSSYTQTPQHMQTLMLIAPLALVYPKQSSLAMAHPHHNDVPIWATLTRQVRIHPIPSGTTPLPSTEKNATLTFRQLPNHLRSPTTQVLAQAQAHKHLQASIYQSVGPECTHNNEENRPNPSSASTIMAHANTTPQLTSQESKRTLPAQPQATGAAALP